MQYEKKTIGRVLTSIADKHSERRALLFDDFSITYNELKKKSVILAYNLINLGVKKDDKVAIIMDNRIEYVFAYFALFLIGAWVVPINIRYEADELRNVLRDSEISTVIYEKQIDNFDYLSILQELQNDLPCLKRHILVSEENIEDKIMLCSLLEIEKNESFDKISERVFEGETEVDEEGVALLAYTSGTTGSPKGVMMQHKNFVSISQSIEKIWQMTVNKGITFSVAPLYAAQGFMALLLELLTGETIRWNSSFVPNDVIKYLKDKEVTAFHTQPTFWNLLLSVPYFHHLDLTHIERCIVSGSICPPTLGKRIAELTKGTVLNAYGLVESTCISTITRLDDSEEIRLNTIGRPIDGVECKIVDENTRKEVKRGDVGELALKGYVMRGYYKKEKETKEVIDDEGWLYTGDMVRYYDNENIAIVGRCKDMVVRGAFNVYPIDIEECLLNFEKVEDVSVVGKPHPILGESLVAFVVPQIMATLTEGEVMKFCRGKISNYKVPDDVIFVSQLPILQSGKVQKNVLREWAVNGVPQNRLLLFNNMILG